MKKIFIILVMGLAVTACSNKIGNTRLGSSESRIEKQMKEIKTKSDARATFGTPNLIFDKDASEIYEYKTISGSGRYHWMIPVVGWITSWWQDTYTYTETNLFIAFDKNDKVKSWNVVKTGGTTD
ncbi:MAG: hypothetical protein LBF37_01250 [Rickettsiales bacterium]|jgi:hypothetical protein|nr:hypothetical protein [Rickettsiales bacterium]